jgi:hypothetical protein
MDYQGNNILCQKWCLGQTVQKAKSLLHRKAKQASVPMKW